MKNKQKQTQKKKPQVTPDQLDITYICPRILAMSFPGDGNPKYKHNISDVAQYLKQRHQNDYQIYNLSGLQYDDTKFQGKVYSFPWEEKSNPNLVYLFMLCKHMDDFLSSKLSNVVVLHCISGRGRTGTVICCYLLYSGRFSSAEEALFYYDKQKYLKGGGITLPSQIRYVQYFEKLLQKQHIYPPIKYITTIVINGIPDIQDKQCKPFLEIYTYLDGTKNLAYTDKISYKEQKKAKDLLLKDIELIRINIAKPFYAIGDVMIKFNHNGIKNNSQAILKQNQCLDWHLILHLLRTSKILTEISKLVARIDELDPFLLQKDNRFPSDLRVQVEFKDFCSCTNEIQFNQRCKSCSNLSKQLCKDWDIVQNILQDYCKHTLEESQILLFGDVAFDNLNEVKYSIFQGGRVRQEAFVDDDDDF